MTYKIRDIFEADFGCEERLPGERLKVMVELVDEAGETSVISAYDEYLRYNKLEVGSIYPECNEEKKMLFWKQKKTMDTLLQTGALDRSQYEYSLGGLIVKMGFDFDILKENNEENQ